MNINSINNYFLKSSYMRRNDVPQEPVSTISTTDNTNFRAKGNPSKVDKFFGENFWGKGYAHGLSNKKWVRSLSEKLSEVPGTVTEHMATLGSLITSGVYVKQTLDNKKLDPDKRRTLAVNQVGCFIVPTICAYTVNSMLANFNKKMEYRYNGLKEQQIAMLRGENAEKARELAEKMGARLKGFGALSRLATFTLIYRYITPVLITPIANKIGDKINSKTEDKVAEAK